MSGKQVVINVGADVRQEDGQRWCDAAAAADDRALEALATPGALLKAVAPLGEESASTRPLLLAQGHDTDSTWSGGVVGIVPAYYRGASDAYTIGLAKAWKVGTGVGPFASTSGSDRFDLVYAVLSRGLLTQESVRMKVLSGGSPIPTLLTTAADMTVTFAIVPNVASGSPLASLPADAIDGSAFNIPICMVKLTNPYTSGTNLNQGAITPLWTRAYVRDHRIERTQLASLFGSGATNAPTTAITQRWGGKHHFFAVHKHTTGNANVEKLVDNGRDWRARRVRISAARIAHSGSIFPEPTGDTDFSPVSYVCSGEWTPTGTGSASASTLFAGDFTIKWRVDNSTGALYLTIVQVPTDGTNSDFWSLDADYTDQVSAALV